MNNRAPDFIKRAEHCLLTNQINVASRYMQIATDELAEQRTRPLEDIPEVRAILAARRYEHLKNVAFPAMKQAFAGMGETLKQAFAPFASILNEAVRRNEEQVKMSREYQEHLSKAARQAMREAEIEGGK